MKKILALALALMMVLALAACGGKDDPAPSGSDNTPASSGSSDPGTSQTNAPGTSGQEQAPSGSGLYDITDEQISAADENYYSTFTYLEGDEEAAMLAKIPSEARKVIGTVEPGLSTIQPYNDGYLLGIELRISDLAEYTALAEHYKSLGGTVTDDSCTDTFSSMNLYTLKVDYEWGSLDMNFEDYSKSDPSHDLLVDLSFNIF